MNGILYFKHRAVRSGNLTEVTLLTTHGSVERGFLGDNCTSLTVSQCLYNLILSRQNGNLGFRCQTIIADKLSCNSRIDGLVYRNIRAHIVSRLSRRSRLLFLAFHRCVEAVLIDTEVLLLENLTG